MPGTRGQRILPQLPTFAIGARKSRSAQSSPTPSAARLFKIVPAPPGWLRTRTTLCVQPEGPRAGLLSCGPDRSPDAPVETKVADDRDPQPRIIER